MFLLDLVRATESTIHIYVNSFYATPRTRPEKSVFRGVGLSRGKEIKDKPGHTQTGKPRDKKFRLHATRKSFELHLPFFDFPVYRGRVDAQKFSGFFNTAGFLVGSFEQNLLNFVYGLFQWHQTGNGNISIRSR